MKSSIISDQIHDNLENALIVMKGMGYTYVELHKVFNKSIEECDDYEIDQIKQLLQKYEMNVSNIASTIFFMCPLYDHYQISLFKDSFPVVRGNINDHYEWLRKACRIANKLNCPYVRVFPFRFPDNEDIVVVGTLPDIDKIANIMKKAAHIAAEYQVTLVLENCPYSHCPKGEMTNLIVNKVNEPNFKLLWDPGNSYRAEKHKVPIVYRSLSLFEEWDVICDNVAHLHLKNYKYEETLEKPFVHKALCDGDINYETLFSQIKNTKYQGAYSLECETCYKETLQSMHDLKDLL